MLRSALIITLGIAGIAAHANAADVYKYTDERGNTLYTDKPRTLPAERMAVKTQRTDAAAVQARTDADMKRMAEADKARQVAASGQSDQTEATQLTAKDKAERCTKARERYDSYMNSQRLYESLPNNERRYLTDAELTSARDSAKVSMDALCK